MKLRWWSGDVQLARLTDDDYASLESMSDGLYIAVHRWRDTQLFYRRDDATAWLTGMGGGVLIRYEPASSERVP